MEDTKREKLLRARDAYLAKLAEPDDDEPRDLFLAEECQELFDGLVVDDRAERKPNGLEIQRDPRVKSNKTRAPGDLTQEEWRGICAAFGGSCAYCRGEKRSGEPHLDHVIPVALGGETSASNVVPACSACNMSKGRKRIEAWLQETELLEFLERWTYGDTYEMEVNDGT